MAKIRFEYRTDCSNKFWEPSIFVDESCKKVEFKVRFGKVGTSGQVHTKKCSSLESALTKYRKLAREKLAKGYKPTQETLHILIPTAVSKPMAIASLYIGEHVPDDIIQDICGWVTACIYHEMSPNRFKKTWLEFIEQENEELGEALGRTGKNFWLDVTEWGEGELSDLYTKAVQSGGTHFTGFNNNAFVDIVALRGNPGARAIKICVLGEENCKLAQGENIKN